MPNGEPRRDSNRTAQIVGGIAVLVVLVALGYFFWPDGEQAAQEPEEGGQPAAVEETEPTGSPEPEEPELKMPDAVAQYIELARESYVEPEGRAKYDHRYTAERLSALGDALVAFGGLIDDAEGDLDSTRTLLSDRSEAIQVDWTDRHSDDVREAFLNAVDAFGMLRDRVDGANGTESLRERARAIEAGRLYLEQTSRAEAFFSSAADRFEALFEALERQRRDTGEGATSEGS